LALDESTSLDYSNSTVQNEMQYPSASPEGAISDTTPQVEFEIFTRLERTGAKEGRISIVESKVKLGLQTGNALWDPASESG
jgi:hypothetical protein